MAGTFKASALTDKGIELLAKVQTNKAVLKLTKAEAGNGTYEDGEVLRTATGLKSSKQTFGISGMKIVNKSTVAVKILATNQQESGNLEHGYYVREIGLFAEDPDEGEILYAIAIQDTDKSDYMPAFNGTMPAEITLNFYVEVANAEDTILQAVKESYVYDDQNGIKYKAGSDDGILYLQDADDKDAEKIYFVDQKSLFGFLFKGKPITSTVEDSDSNTILDEDGNKILAERIYKKGA